MSRKIDAGPMLPASLHSHAYALAVAAESAAPNFEGAETFLKAFFEGSPGSVIEAMSYGLPLILSDIPEHREIAVEGENTIFFPLKNINQMTGIFDKVFEQEYHLEQLGSHSKRIFSERFKEEIIYSEYDVLYKRIYNNLK